MLTNAHDASTIRYGASTIQAGSATVASRPLTNLHDLVVAMRQSRGGGGGGVLSIFLHTLARAQHLPFIPPPKKKINKKKGISRTPKIFEILATPQNTPILYIDLKKDPKMHRNDP